MTLTGCTKGQPLMRLCGKQARYTCPAHNGPYKGMHYVWIPEAKYSLLYTDSGRVHPVTDTPDQNDITEILPIEKPEMK